MEITVWGQTRERWIREGMPEDADTVFMHRGSDYFGLEGYETLSIDAISPRPRREKKVIEETDEYELFVDGLARPS